MRSAALECALMRARNNDGERAQQRARGEEGGVNGDGMGWDGLGGDPVLPKIKAAIPCVYRKSRLFFNIL